MNTIIICTTIFLCIVVICVSISKLVISAMEHDEDLIESINIIVDVRHKIKTMDRQYLTADSIKLLDDIDWATREYDFDDVDKN